MNWIPVVQRLAQVRRFRAGRAHVGSKNYNDAIAVIIEVRQKKYYCRQMVFGCVNHNPGQPQSYPALAYGFTKVLAR
jgi:hypothetical protein